MREKTESECETLPCMCSSFRRSVRVREVILAPGASKRYLFPLTRGVHLKEVINREF